MKLALAALLSALLLCSCATPYGELGPMGGFTETELSPSRWEISMIGNDWSGPDQLKSMVYRRAKERAALERWDDYEVVDFNVGREPYGLNVWPGAVTARATVIKR